MFKSKISLPEKLRILSALDNGFTKVALARRYGVHPQTISCISKQKEILLKKHKQKLAKNTDPCCLDPVLLGWLKAEIDKGNHINEHQLHCKAKELLSSIGTLDIGNLDDWLLEFRLNHDIIEYVPENEYESKFREEWKNLVEGYRDDSIYLGGVCGLLHSLDLDSYMAGIKSEKHVSLFFTCNSTGTDRRKLVVVGNEELPASEAHLKTLPVSYYLGEQPLVNFKTIYNYLSSWNHELLSKEQNVALVLDLPEEFLGRLYFDKIKILRPKDTNLVKEVIDRISQCLKFYYRKLQISRSLVNPSEKDNLSILNNLNLIAMSWRSLLPQYIHNLTHPLPEGSLLFNEEDSDKIVQKIPCLSEWSRTASLPLKPEAHDILDQFVAYDCKLMSLNHDTEIDDVPEAVFNVEVDVSSGIEAYQAMKRLYTYLQEAGASNPVLDSAQSLEDFTEHGAMLEIHRAIADDSTNSD